MGYLLTLRVAWQLLGVTSGLWTGKVVDIFIVTMETKD